MLAPPTDKIPEFLILRRTPFSQDVEVFYPDKNSYSSNMEETEKLLKRFKCKDPNDVCLSLQNFNLVRWTSKSDEVEIINLYKDFEKEYYKEMKFDKPLR